MASKKPKAELVAICKLEFYRKQKNWRHCPPERKGKDPKRRTKTTNTKGLKAKLNQTYNIATEAPESPEKQEPSVLGIQETDERHILDEAFVETETGTESDEAVQREDQELNALRDVADEPSSQPDPPGSPYSPKWSMQRWAERRGLWNPEPAPTSDPICPTHDPTCPTHDPTCPTLDPLCPIHNPTFPQQTSPREEANCPTFDNNYNTIQDVYYSNQYLNLPHKGTDYDANYPVQSCDTKYAQEPIDPKYGVSMVYYNSNLYQQDLNVALSGTGLLEVGKLCEWRADDWERCAGEGAAWSDAAWLQEAAAGAGAGEGAVGAGGEDAVDGDWQLHDLSGDVSQCSSAPSAASSEFLRGASLAPHSTQIDLLVGAEPAPALLAAGALAAAVAHHSAALRALLVEAQRRDQMASEPVEVPVREPGPALFNDRIVARSRPARRGHTGAAGHIGSVGHSETVGHIGSAGHSGTGPGQAGQTEVGRGRGRPKVGIRMGRPYRL